MKKVVLKLDLHDDRAKRKALKAVSTLSGIESIAMEMKDGKMTVIGDVDPVVVVGKLRRTGWHAELLTVGPAKEEKKEDSKKDETKIINIVPIDPLSYNAYYNPQYYYHLPPAEDNTSCVIC